MPEIGDTLREARMRAKIDISEVEAETKIRAKYLRALENEEWGLLPGSTFVKTFLRTYAEYLGLDGRHLIEEYKARYEPMSTSEMAPFTPALGERPRERFRPRGPGRGTVVGAVVVTLVALLFLLGKFFPDNNGSGSSNTVAGTTTTPKHRAAKKHAAAPAPAPKPTKVKLQVVPTAAVWVCLEDGNGKRLIGGTLIDPQTPKHTYTAKKFRITLGNSQVSMKVDGKTLGVPARPGPVGYVVTPRGRTELPTGKQPTCA
jgi:cytoskeleton protein RodZ